MKSATAAKGILASTTKKNPLREIFDIRREELPIVTLLFLFFFLVIAVFQILRPLKKGLFVEYYGADLELYAKLSNILVAAVGVAVFTYLYKKLPRQRLLYVFCGFFIVCFVALGFALTGAEPLPIWGFYVLGDLLSTLMVAAFFAFLTDVATPDQAKRLFGVIGGGGVFRRLGRQHFGSDPAKHHQNSRITLPLGSSDGNDYPGDPYPLWLRCRQLLLRLLQFVDKS
jgi:MFS transporter